MSDREPYYATDEISTRVDVIGLTVHPDLENLPAGNNVLTISLEMQVTDYDFWRRLSARTRRYPFRNEGVCITRFNRKFEVAGQGLRLEAQIVNGIGPKSPPRMEFLLFQEGEYSSPVHTEVRINSIEDKAYVAEMRGIQGLPEIGRIRILVKRTQVKNEHPLDS